MKHFLQALALLLCVAGSSVAGQRTDVEFAVPGNSAQPPQMAAAPDGTLYLVYGAGHAIYCVVSRDGGRSFGLPAALEAGGMLMLGRHRGPRVAATNDAVTITAIAGKRGGGQDGNLLAGRSTDHGKTWGRPVVLNDVTDAAREGLHGLAAGPGNLVFAVWLDLRKDESSDGGTNSMEPSQEMEARPGKRTGAFMLLRKGPSANAATHPSPLTPKAFCM